MISGTFLVDLLSSVREPDDLAALSAATRQAFECGEPILLTTSNWREYAGAHSTTSVTTKRRKLLEYVRRRSTYVGEVVAFTHADDYPLIDARNPQECWALMSHLQQRGLIAPGQDQSQWVLTMGAWELLEPTSGGGVPGLCFVAMSFAPSLDAAYDKGVKAAVETDCGFKAVRVDKIHHGDKICDRIITEIKRSQFMVADFTGHRGGVYFEAGYAQALGREVIWSCREDDFDKLHFDTRQFAHIKWKDPEDLRRQLADRIRALIPGARLD